MKLWPILLSVMLLVHTTGVLGNDEYQAESQEKVERIKKGAATEGWNEIGKPLINLFSTVIDKVLEKVDKKNVENTGPKEEKFVESGDP